MRTQEETQREVALTVAVMYQEELFVGSVLASFDVAYQLALNFVKLYPSEYDWEEHTEREGRDFYEEVIHYVKLSAPWQMIK